MKAIAELIFGNMPIVHGPRNFQILPSPSGQTDVVFVTFVADLWPNQSAKSSSSSMADASGSFSSNFGSNLSATSISGERELLYERSKFSEL